MKMPGIKTFLACATLLPTMVAASASSHEEVAHSSAMEAVDFDPAGYRIARYRGPIDRAPTPATRISLERALRLKPGENALFIDVLPAEGGVRDPITGRWQLADSHLTIPGALWLPETGRGHPDVALWLDLRTTVAEARKQSPAIPVVLFCRTDCWMGWNAARRLSRDGFGNVHWLAEGIEGWHDAGKPLVPAAPAIVPAN